MRFKPLFPITIGLSDGIITALMLVSGDILRGEHVLLGLALRVAYGSSFVGTFSFFIAQYSELRGELSRSSKQLNLRSPSYLIRSKVGRDIIFESVLGASAAGFFGFVGALIPLIPDVFFPSMPIVAIGFAEGSLAVLGLGIGRAVRGNYIFWIIMMFIIGLVVAWAGDYLFLVQ